MKYALARLSPYWGELLTQSERDAWNLYGANVAMSNVLGQTFHLTGQNHFLRANIPRIQSGISVLKTAPTTFDLGTFTAPTIFAAWAAPPSFKIAFDNTDDWANGLNGTMLIYEGRPAGPGQSYFGGPYRYAGRVVIEIPPPASPIQLSTVWGIEADRLLWVHIRIIQDDGRLSLPIILGPYTTTAM